MLYISGPCTIITIGISFTLMVKHLLCYCRPREQRQIIRIAFLPPLYSIMSFFTIYSYPDSLYLKPAQDLYEPVALASLFFLYTEFAAPDPATRETYFAELENRRKIGGRFSKKYEAVPGGSLRWFQVRIEQMLLIIFELLTFAFRANGLLSTFILSPLWALKLWKKSLRRLVGTVQVLSALNMRIFG